jgi:hypothetical protein
MFEKYGVMSSLFDFLLLELMTVHHIIISDLTTACSFLFLSTDHGVFIGLNVATHLGKHLRLFFASIVFFIVTTT